MRITLVSSIGELFHAYWYVFPFWKNTSWLTRYCPAISCVLFRNNWYFLTLSNLLLQRARGQNGIWRILHIYSKAPWNRLYAYITNTSTMPNNNTTSSINNLASDSDLVSVVIDDTTNCVNSPIVLSRLHPSWLLCSDVTGDSMSTWII